ncbi:MAG: hypothetical protein ABI607_14725 [Betaproteobacteria bacterium]
MRLVLAVPDLLAHDRGALASLSSLARLAQFSNAPVVRQGALDDFLVTPARSATAALAALGAGYDPGAKYVLRADPVSLVAGRNDVVLSAHIDDLDAVDTAALLATLNAHFSGDRLAFHAPRPDAWFVESETAPDFRTTPLPAVRGAIYPHLPTGNDGPQWRRWLSEMQMLLHEHPANAVRAAHGRVPVTGIWISGGGRLTDIAPTQGARTFATKGPAGDVARGLAERNGIFVSEPPLDFSALQTEVSAIVVLSPAARMNVGDLDRDWLAPAVRALEHGALDGLTLLADGLGVAASWHAERPAWSRRISAQTRALLAPRPFVPPAPEGDDA